MNFIRRDIVRDLYKNNKISKELRDEIKKLIKKLKKIDKNTYEHSLRVAEKVYDICKYLNFDNNKITLITIAALLHDVGKVQIFNLFFNLKDKEDLEQVWKYYYGDKEPKNNYAEILTVKEIIEFYAYNKNPSNLFIENFNEFWNKKGYSKNQYENMTMMDYLHSHQTKTKDLLLEIKLPYSIILFAATHHTSYFKDRKKIPIESRIIEICDKYDALTESNRNYRKDRTPFEAIITIIDELNDDLFLFNNTNNENKKILIKIINYFLNLNEVLYSFDTYFDTILLLLKSEKVNIIIKIKILKRIKTIIKYILSENFSQIKYKSYYKRVLAKLGKVCEEYTNILK